MHTCWVVSRGPVISFFYRNSHSSDECKSFVETIGEAGVTLNHGVFVRSCFGIEFYCQRLKGVASSTFLRPQAVFSFHLSFSLASSRSESYELVET